MMMDVDAWFTEVGSRPGGTPTFADVPCPHRRSIEQVETTSGCCSGMASVVQIGHCHRGPHTPTGFVEGTLACVDCGERLATGETAVEQPT